MNSHTPEGGSRAPVPDNGNRAPVPDDATRRQLRAAAPDRSSWVAANAGSGKTRVLTDRVARLLLAGTEPQRILCLTYTKAAAAEMQSRLFSTLGSWAMRDEADLAAQLAALGAPPEALTGPALAKARTLFARALETPGGLRIQTIHAFCEALLRRFPLEAGIAPGFSVLDDRAAKAMREEVLDSLALARPDLVTAIGGELSEPDPFLLEIGSRRDAFADPLDRAALAAALGLPPGLDLPALAASLVTPADRDLLATLARLGEASGSNDRKVAATLREALACSEPASLLGLLESACLSGKDCTPRAFPAKAVRTAHPEVARAFDDFVARVVTARDQRLALATLARSTLLHDFARAWLAALDQRKAGLALLDFDDMIERVRRLLADDATAAWVLWKLDGGIDHILVDEAQDTSPAQWRVVEALSEEFFAGEGARPGLERTVFVVGDEKQSIYSFQGADPEAFGSMRRHFEERLAAMGRELQHCGLIHSFRSAQPVLDLVDQVFAGRAGAGLDTSTRHVAFRPDLAGRVELWPFRPKPEKPDEGEWWLPLDMPHPGDPVEEMATAVAARIRGWLDEGRILPGTGRRIRAGDVMILVQRRGPPFHAVIRALKRARVPVAGADVLRLGGELAVKDLLAALRVAATPADDLSLAAFLRSPLGELGEAELFELAHGRPRSLLAALRDRPPGDWPRPRAILAELRDQADWQRPFELLQRILVRHDGRRSLVARLGSEAEDGIDALLQAALDYEAAEPPTLSGFLDWIDHDEMAVKRRSDDRADEVRVMTVHGAKGLEAEIVILPDTGTREEHANAPQVLRLADGRAVWRPRTTEAPEATREAEEARRARVRAENMRLLYVALTRARRWLLVCGAGAEPKEDGLAWHPIVAKAMADLGAATDADGVRHIDHLWSEEADARAPRAEPPEPAPVAPASAAAPAPAPTPLSPSGLGGAHALAITDPALLAGPAETEAEARARGEALHRLLEHLHRAPADTWPTLGARLLPAAEGLAELLAEAGAVLAMPEAAEVFGPGSLAEVDVTAALPELAGARLLGRIDRLVVTPGRVLAVDFKSNRQVPAGAGTVPEGILRQMGAYRAALSRIWPGRPVSTAILWTRGPLLMPLADAAVDAALARAATERAG